jgi:hypothetical protein
MALRSVLITALTVCTSILTYVSCVPLEQQPGYSSQSSNRTYVQEKRLRTDDFIYEPSIRTPMLYPRTGKNNEMLGIPVLALLENLPLELIFDELGNQYHNYYARIIHCNSDWTPSMLKDMEFLNEFNEYPITEYEISLNTRTPYVHYRFVLPRVKVSGNYVLAVYREGNRDDFLLTRRFMIYENLVTIGADIKFSTGIDQRYTHQQVDFVVNYSGYDLIANMPSLKVAVRQNNRWDNAITNLKPMFIRDNQKILDYNFFNLENNFRGGNEFRTFDTRSIQFLGLGMKGVQRTENRVEIAMQTDRSRKSEVYTQFIDINGRFVIEHHETRRGATESDYAFVNFELAAPAAVPGRVYVFGALSDWKLKDEFLMTYDEAANKYRGRVLLKQGYYNYMYMVESAVPNAVDKHHFEGDHHITENFYDILVYFRPIGGRADQLIGYTNINYFGRQ